MKRIALGLSFAFAFGIATLLIAPSFIDWSAYRTVFEDRLAAATGRAVTIDGDVVLSLLPRPAFQADALRVANSDGAVNADFIQAERVAVNLAFGPLLQGRLQFTSIDIVNPIINAEVLADGTTSWTLNPESSASAGSEPDVDGAAFDLGVDSLRVSNGTVHYQDAATGTKLLIEGITMDLEAASISGPFQIKGDASVLGMSWVLDLSVGVLQDDRPSALSGTISNSGLGLRIELSGRLSPSDDGVQLTGRLTSEAENLSQVLQGFGVLEAGQLIPVALRERFRAEAAISANGAAIDAESLEVSIGGVGSKGTARYSWQDGGQFALTLSASRIDLEEWMLGQFDGQTRFRERRDGVAIRSALAQPAAGSFYLPTDLAGSIDLDVGLIAWRGQVMRNARFSASLNDAEITVTEAGLELPGNTSLTATGFVKAEAGAPVFDLNGQASSQDLRTVLDWVGAAPPPGLVSASRLNTLSLVTHLTGSLNRLVFNELDVKLDATEMAGSAAIDLEPTIRPSLILNVSSFDLDSYLPAIRDRMRDQSAPLSTGISEPVSDDDDTIEGGSFESIEATANLKVGVLTAGGKVFRGVAADMSVNNGEITVRELSVEDFAGAALKASGTIENVGSSPRVDAVSIQVSTADLARLNRAIDLDLPRLPILEGSVNVDALVSGTPESASVEVAAELGDLKVSANGEVQRPLAKPEFNFETALSHPEYTELMRSINFARPRGTQAVGAVSASGVVSFREGNLQVEELVTEVGVNKVSASLNYDTTNVLPNLSGGVAMQYLDFDQLFPADPTKQLARSSRSRGQGGQSGSTVSDRWTADPIDLGALSRVNAVLNITADRIFVRGLDVEQLNAQVTLADSVISASGWQGRVYGGPATGDFRLTASPTIQVETQFSISEADMGRMGGGLSGPSQASGKVSMDGTFSTAGQNQRDLVTALNGQGRFIATGIDANSAGQGLALTAVMAPVRALSQLGGVFSGGVTQGLATMGTEFSGQNGVFTLSNAALRSNVYSGNFAGTVDLPRWWVDVEGRVRLEVNVITQLLGNRLQMPSLIPLTIQGPLDLPNVKMDAVRGGPDAQSSGTSVPTQVAPAPTNQPNPVDLFQGILNELTKPR